MSKKPQKQLNAFKNVIATGTLAGNDGRKMSKSFGNYTDPNELMDQFSADSYRFTMLASPVLAGEDFALKDKDVSDVARKLSMVWNMYDFFTMYAEVDGWEYEPKATTYILCGGNDRKYDDFGNNLAKEIAKTVKNPRILDVFFMRQEKDWENNFGVWTEFYDKYFAEYTHEMATIENFYEQVENADVIFFHGGRTQLLLENLPDFEKVRNALAGKIYVGSSAGANYLAENSLSHDGIAPGSGILPINVVVHYEGKAPEGRCKKDADELEKLHPRKTLRIREGEFVVYKNSLTEPQNLTNPLDKWVISRLHQMAQHVEKHLDDYNLPEACSAILPFLDDASNWYVRRSRRRFWKSEDDGDKNDAYKTLHYVLAYFALVIAPFCPFMAEELWQKMVGGESVHLLDWPSAGTIDEKVLGEMKATREIIEQGLAQRMSHDDEFGQIKVRQPLAKLTYSGEKLDDFYEQIIAEEVNVKAVTCGKELALDKTITPELKREGQAREIIRVIQKARKEAGFKVDDRIVVDLATDDKGLNQAINEFRDTIAVETLATKFSENDGYQSTAKIDGAEIAIRLRKI